MRLKEKERPRGLLVWLALQVAFIYIYIYIVGRFSSVHHGCIREISRQDVYTYISFKQETHYLCWPSFFNAADIYSRIRRGDELTPTLVFNKAETRIVKLNLNCVIIQVSLSLFLVSFFPCIYSVRFPSSIRESFNNPFLFRFHHFRPFPLSPHHHYFVTLVHRQSFSLSPAYRRVYTKT